MRQLIAAHADAIVGVASAIFIFMASVDAIDDLRRAPFGNDNAQFTRRRLVLFVIWVSMLLALVGTDVYASGYASARMQVIFGYANLYCALMFTIRDGLKRKTTKGYAYAAVCILILAVAACVTVLAPLSN